MKCCLCGKEIWGPPMTIKRGSKLLPAHRDCGRFVSGKNYAKKKPRSQVTKALRDYRKEHE